MPAINRYQLGPVPWNVRKDFRDPASLTPQPPPFNYDGLFFDPEFPPGVGGAALYEDGVIMVPAVHSFTPADVVQACEPFWRIRELTLTFSLTWGRHYTDSGIDDLNTTSGTIKMRHAGPDVFPSGGDFPIDETELPLCNRIESFGTGTVTFSDNRYRQSTPTAGSLTVDRREIYCNMYVPAFWSLWDRGTFGLTGLTLFQPNSTNRLSALGNTYDYARTSPHYGTEGSQDDTFSDASLTVDLTSHWPDHHYTIPLACAAASGAGSYGYVTGTVNVVPSRYWTYGGKWNETSGARM